MSTMTQNQSDLDHQLWRDAVKGDTKAFEYIVIRHQSAVSAVAFSIVGDFSTSQDIAQETFWAAWTSRDRLRESRRIGAWLCGIARNLSKQWRRKKFRAREVDEMGMTFEPQSTFSDPVDQFISAEEESVVWNSLEKIPENYREVLVLYYRRGQSIEQVAEALEISNEAARQRLSRGRQILRNHVSNLIEGVLDRSNPNRSFTARVMAGITGAGLASQAATSSAAPLSGATTATTATTAKLLAAGTASGISGGLLGVFGGLFGAWLGHWLPAQLAMTETERQLLLERSRKVIAMSVLFTLLIVSLTVALVFFPQQAKVYFVGVFVATVAFVLLVLRHNLKTQRLVAILRKELSPEEDPNRSKLSKKAQTFTSKAANSKGRRYTSSAKLFGLPLLDMQFSDPITINPPKKIEKSKPRLARGWIAMGDVAQGVLLAVGGRATGGIAIGGLSAGIVSVGGLSIGIFSLGGFALGLLLAIGGAAVGYDAAGGLAIGWHSGAGGLGIAYHAAAGGAAIAHDYAVGGAAYAAEANTQIARQVIEKETMIWLLKLNWLGQVAVAVFTTLPFLFVPLFYSQTPATDSNDAETPKRS